MSVERPHSSPSPQEIEEGFWEKAADVLEGRNTYVTLYDNVHATSDESVAITAARKAMFQELGCVKATAVASERVDMVNGLEYRIISHEQTPDEWPSIRAVVEDSILVFKTAAGDQAVVKQKAFLYKPRG